MRSIKLLIVLVCLVIASTSGYGQDVKVGYTNVELVLAYMPQAKSMEQQLQTYQQKLGEQLQVKQNYLQQRYQEYVQLKEANRLSQTDAQTREAELTKLDEDVQKLAAESEQKLLTKREELLSPILEKLQSTIDKVAERNGYTYILNQTTSSGVSTILYGPEENDITEELMRDLGIQIPN